MKEDVIKFIKSAQIKLDWEYEVLALISNKYALGYITAKIEDVDSTQSEEFRQYLIKLCNYDIWNQ